MKNCFFIFSFVLAFVSLKAQNTDLPGPTPNLQTLPSGSYVIAMDNTLQVNSTGDFNLKAYGMIVYLLNKNIKIKWCIRAGKAKDGIDFTGTAEQLKPVLVAGGISRNFKAGPFVISASDTNGVAALVDSFYLANSLTGNNRPQVYRLTAAATGVDIRYDLTGFRPKAGILTDGTNQSIHVAYMTAASIPTESYTTTGGANLISDCYTFASEPHNTKTGATVDTAISRIRNFVLQGGNFLAQCEAISNYENNSLGRFQTSSGISITNSGIGTTLLFPNPDLSFCQFEGDYNASLGGSLKNWKILGSSTNYEHNFATGTGSNTNILGASVSKLYADKGGLVFYVGNHSFPTTSLAGINGIRMYMDAFLTPSNTNCPSQMFFVLPVKLLEFSGKRQNSQVSLTWTLAANEKATRISIEKSKDGIIFTPCGLLSGSGRSGKEIYRFNEQEKSEMLYYRLKITEQQGNSYYSPIVTIKEENDSHQTLFITNSTTGENMVMYYQSATGLPVSLHVYNSTGILMYAQTINCVRGNNQISIPAQFADKPGSYLVEVVDGNHQRTVTKTIRL